MASTAWSPAYYEEKYQQVKALWIFVTVRAAYDYALGRHEVADVKKVKEARTASQYLFDEGGGLEEIAEVFDLPLEKIRKWAKDLTKNDLTKIEIFERRGGGNFLAKISELAGSDGNDKVD